MTGPGCPGPRPGSAASAVGFGDLPWVLSTLGERRERLVRFAPVFWRPATDAARSHRAFIEHLLRDGGAKAYRTDSSVLIAVRRGEGWLVDDAHVPGGNWTDGDGRLLWNALDDECHGAPVRFVCPTYEEDRAEFARTAGLAVAESWWLTELPSAFGGEPGAEFRLPGADAITVAAPPVYAPHGPVLFLPAVSDARAAVPAAVAEAPRLGCPAIVVNQVAGAHDLARELAAQGFRRHCDYYTGVVHSR